MCDTRLAIQTRIRFTEGEAVMKKKKDLVGQMFGILVVVAPAANKVTSGGNPLSYDFGLNNSEGTLIVLIECQGRQHFFASSLFGGEEQFAIQQEHDRRKREYAREHGIPLIKIPYTCNTQEKVNAFLDDALSALGITPPVPEEASENDSPFSFHSNNLESHSNTSESDSNNSENNSKASESPVTKTFPKMLPRSCTRRPAPVAEAV